MARKGARYKKQCQKKKKEIKKEQIHTLTNNNNPALWAACKQRPEESTANHQQIKMIETGLKEVGEWKNIKIDEERVENLEEEMCGN